MIGCRTLAQYECTPFFYAFYACFFGVPDTAILFDECDMSLHILNFFAPKGSEVSGFFLQGIALLKVSVKIKQCIKGFIAYVLKLNDRFCQNFSLGSWGARRSWFSISGE